MCFFFLGFIQVLEGWRVPNRLALRGSWFDKGVLRDSTAGREAVGVICAHWKRAGCRSFVCGP